MKKIISLIKACMTSDMSLFKIKTKKKNALIPLFIALYLMFMIWCSANSMFEKLEQFNISYVLLSLLVFGISFMTFIEGIYKSGSLIFNCKDDQLLLSLPIKRRTVLFIRIFKFYVFEILFNSLFLLPIMVAYIRWGNVDLTYYLTCIVMLFMIPIIPIVLSTIVGVITSSLSSKFKYKNMVQIIISMVLIIGIMGLSYNMDGLLEYIAKHATSMNDLIGKIYYPSLVFANLITDFKVTDLLIFVLVNISIFVITIFILSKFYFKINSRLKKITTSNKKIKIKNLSIKSKTPVKAIVEKELVTFFKTPVFIINAGFALVLFLLAAIVLTFKFDGAIAALTNDNSFGLTQDTIMNNLSIFVFIMISLTAYMTSITNSIISLEGRNINILKSLPIKVKTILIGKVLAALTITTPVLLIGDIMIFIVLKISIIEMILLLILSILIPLVSHFIGIIVNLKFPKLDWENSTEVVKQSTSSFIAVMLGMSLFIMTVVIVTNLVSIINSCLLLFIITIVYIIIDFILYTYLVKKGVKYFNELTI